MGKTVFVLDDESDILSLLENHLQKSDFTVLSFDNQHAFMDALENQFPALAIIDLMLPDGNGLEICRELKNSDRYCDIPIVVLSAIEDENTKLACLEAGAEDYLTKPFSPRELVARLHAILRRVGGLEKERVIGISDYIRMNLSTHETWIEKKRVDLTLTEFRILKLLLENPGTVFDREQILLSIRGNGTLVVDRTVDVHIKNLRDKLRETGHYIKNVRGIGYKLDSALMSRTR